MLHVLKTQNGVIIDNKLRWSDHINYIKNKISKSIGIINKTRNFLNKNTLRNLYYTFILPLFIHISYTASRSGGIQMIFILTR